MNVNCNCWPRLSCTFVFLLLLYCCSKYLNAIVRIICLQRYFLIHLLVLFRILPKVFSRVFSFLFFVSFLKPKKKPFAKSFWKVLARYERGQCLKKFIHRIAASIIHNSWDKPCFNTWFPFLSFSIGTIVYNSITDQALCHVEP